MGNQESSQKSSKHEEDNQLLDSTITQYVVVNDRQAFCFSKDVYIPIQTFDSQKVEQEFQKLVVKALDKNLYSSVSVVTNEGEFPMHVLLKEHKDGIITKYVGFKIPRDPRLVELATIAMMKKFLQTTHLNYNINPELRNFYNTEKFTWISTENLFLKKVFTTTNERPRWISAPKLSDDAKEKKKSTLTLTQVAKLAILGTSIATTAVIARKSLPKMIHSEEEKVYSQLCKLNRGIKDMKRLLVRYRDKPFSKENSRGLSDELAELLENIGFVLKLADAGSKQTDNAPLSEKEIAELTQMQKQEDMADENITFIS
jgi:hypothetical protein